VRQGCGFAYGIRLIPIEELLEHEEVVEDHVQLLIMLILKDGMLHYPILVEMRHKVILDGHHRFNALKRLGAAYVPALLINYSSPAIKVLSWRPEVKVTKELVIRAALSRRKLPPKTSRHVLIGYRVPKVDVPLKHLLIKSNRFPYIQDNV